MARRPTLTIFKFKPKTHAQDFTRLALYFNKLWQRSFKRGPRQNIPLSRLNQTVAKRNRPLVKMVANIWFEQQSRGSNISHRCSEWERRPAPRLNKMLIAALRSLQDDNIEVVDEMWSVAGQKNEVEVVIKTTIKFPDADGAAAFHEQVAELLATTKDEDAV